MNNVVMKEWNDIRKDLTDTLKQMIEDDNPESETLEIMLSMLKSAKVKESKRPLNLGG